MRFRFGPQPKPIDVLRKWDGPGGETWAVHPLFLAMREAFFPGRAKWSVGDDWLPAGRPSDWIATLHRLLDEVARGERRFSKELGARVLAIDEEQRASGCPDENLPQLVELLEGASS